MVRLSIKRVLYMKTIDNDIKAGDFKSLSAVWTGEIPHKTVQGQADKGYGQ